MNVSIKSYISSLIVIFSLMVLALILTFIIPSGEYYRVIENGKEIIDVSRGFQLVDNDFKIYKWILSPILVLTVDGSLTIILVIVFLLVIGGIFNVLYDRQLIVYMINKIANKYGNKRKLLLAMLILVFMLLGSFIGSFEEVVPLVPIVASLVIMLGYDPLVGLGISILACGCGFATGIMNPFTVGVAQTLAGITPMYSGVWLRIVSFILIYFLLLGFILLYSKKIAKNTNKPDSESEEINIKFEYDKKKDRAINSFIITLGIGILLIVSSAVITALQDYTMVIVALMFLVGGIVAGFISGISVQEFFKSFLKGVVGVLPAVLMILMASSIRYTLEEAKILDTIMHFMVSVIPDNKALVILSIYLIVLIMNFFIASGSAKAFLLIPLIIPIANMFGVSPQLCILAFIFGDGFSNVFYPTNPVLLISLGLTETSYTKYFKFVWKFQALNLVLTCIILLLGLAVGY